jgi:hypothetical protein
VVVDEAAVWPNLGLATHPGTAMVRAMVEPGLVTLAKIVGTLLLAMGVIPFLFLLSPGGDKSEPKENFDDL